LFSCEFLEAKANTNNDNNKLIMLQVKASLSNMDFSHLDSQRDLVPEQTPFLNFDFAKYTQMFPIQLLLP